MLVALPHARMPPGRGLGLPALEPCTLLRCTPALPLLLLGQALLLPGVPLRRRCCLGRLPRVIRALALLPLSLLLLNGLNFALQAVNHLAQLRALAARVATGVGRRAARRRCDAAVGDTVPAPLLLPRLLCCRGAAAAQKLGSGGGPLLVLCPLLLQPLLHLQQPPLLPRQLRQRRRLYGGHLQQGRPPVCALFGRC